MKRQSKRLASSLEHRLNSYALAASAAGVSLLALSKPADARVVCTRTHHIIGPAGKYHLDLNHDGVADFVLSNWPDYPGGGALVCREKSKGCNYRSGTANNEVWGTLTFFRESGDASALPPGFRIGANSKHFRPTNSVMYGKGCHPSFCTTNGRWRASPYDRYLGFKFSIGGETHYGWARLSLQLVHFGIHETLSGYAYETVPNKPVITGRTEGKDVVTLPATLGRLAQGASGLSAWRGTNSPAAAR